MATGAGEYRERLTWLRRVKAPAGTRDGFGQRADQFAEVGPLWAAVEGQSGLRTTSKESEGDQVTATVRVRQYPAIVAGDRLRSVRWGDVWTVESVVRGDNELSLEVTRPRWTTGGGTPT